jgi:hypothetical protein
MIEYRPFIAEDYLAIYKDAVDVTAREMSGEEVYLSGKYHEAGGCAFSGWWGDLLLGCLGIDTVRPGVGHMWAIINTKVRDYVIPSMRACRMMLGIVEEEYGFGRLRCESRIGFPESQRFLEFLGFRRGRRTIMNGTHYFYRKIICHR